MSGKPVVRPCRACAREIPAAAPICRYCGGHQSLLMRWGRGLVLVQIAALLGVSLLHYSATRLISATDERHERERELLATLVNVVVAKRTVEVFQREEQNINKQFEVGEVTRTDVKQVESERARAEVNQARLQSQLLRLMK